MNGMSSDMAALVAMFHQRMGIEPGSLDDAAFVRLRMRLAAEEHAELMDELAKGDRVGVAQELADVVVIAYGTAELLGIDLDAVLAEVMRANLSKVGPGGPIFREDGKVLKPEGFRPADVAAVLARSKAA